MIEFIIYAAYAIIACILIVSVCYLAVLVGLAIVAFIKELKK